MLETLPAAVYTIDAAGRITYFNQAAADLWGCRPELGKSEWCGSWRLYWPDGRPMRHDECPMAVALKEGRPMRGAEAAAERPDGTRVPFLAYPTPLRDRSDALTGAVNTLIDITERKRIEQLAQRLGAIIESSDDAIVSKDVDGIIQSWNPGAERLFGYTADEVIGKPITLLIPTDRHDEESEILSRIRRGERVDHYETVRRRKEQAGFSSEREVICRNYLGEDIHGFCALRITEARALALQAAFEDRTKVRGKPAMAKKPALNFQLNSKANPELEPGPAPQSKPRSE